jgi:iron complex outermembrane receptor protein
MNMRTKKFARASASLFTLMLAQTAMAQGAPQQPADADRAARGIQDIVVTATRQATNLQDTPIAITAVTSQELDDRGVKSVADLTSVVPNAQFRRVQGAFGPGVTTFIRGIGTTDTSLGGEAAVAYYIDDIYYPILLGSNFDLLDIAHIEVLRGPQGTLFGRNSLAGAVNIVSKQPNPDHASAYAELTLGGFDRTDVRAGFNVPLGDTAAIMISAMSKKRTGYQKQLDFACEMTRRGTPALAGSFPMYNEQLSRTPNFSPDDCVIGHLGGEDVRAARGSLLWEAAPNVKLTLNADHIWDNSPNPANTTVDINPSLANANLRGQGTYFGIAYDQRLMTGDPFTSYASYRDRISSGTVLPGSTFYTGLKGRGGSQMESAGELRNWGVSGKLVWGFTDEIDVTAIVGYRKMDEHHAFDNDNGPLTREQVASEIGEKYTTAELRLSGQMDMIDWVVGAFYFDAYGYFHATNYSQVNATLKTLVTTYEPNSKAFYGNATIRPFGERLGIVLGARYSWDHKFVDYSNLTDTGPHPNPGDLTFQVDPTQQKFSWKLGLNYQLGNTTLVYASAATGNSLPGYNARPLQPSQVAQFDGNDDIAYEIGAKLDLFDRKLRLNIAAFYTDFNNRPTGVGGAEALIDTATGRNAVGNQVLIPLEGGPAGSTRCRTTVQTPAEAAAGPGISCINRNYYVNQPATVRGFEVEYTIAPTDGLMINGAVGWSKFLSPEIKARTVNRRQGNPFWTANAGIQYRIPADMLTGSITPRLDWSYESSQVISGTSTKYNYLNKARSVFNARLTYENEPYDFTVAVGATNLFNKFYYLNWFDYQANGSPETVAQPAAPRQWFVNFAKKF